MVRFQRNLGDLLKEDSAERKNLEECLKICFVIRVVGQMEFSEIEGFSDNVKSFSAHNTKLL
jgi:hypothetical protein